MQSRCLALAAWIGMLGGCGAERGVSPPAAPPPAAPAALAHDHTPEPAPAAPPGSCVGRTADTKVRAQLIDRGAALVFTTKSDVQTLRRRAADVSMPTTLQHAGPRIDNVHNGVRLVFEARTDSDVETLREEVVEHARQVAKGCGLVLGSPSGPGAPEPRRAEPSATLAPAGSKAKPKPTKEPPREPAAKQPTKPAPKPATKPKPKPPPAPKASPPVTRPDSVDPDKSKGKKPPLPRLPGPHPEPISPRSD